ncbi:hypothetical protein KJ966_23375 [bacterium]|nr:hypothetical protein [bacterium]
MKWLFIDHENIGNLDSLDTGIYRKVYVFVGATHKALKINFIKLHQNVSLEVVKIKNIGQNNLDFHLSYFLGKLDTTADKEIEFVILSKDKGFDHLISFINDSGRKCRRELLSESKDQSIDLHVESQINSKVIEPEKTPTRTNPILSNDLQQNVSDILNRLNKISGQKRPRKKKTLINFIKTVHKNMADEIFNQLEILKCIQDNGKSITYSIDTSASPISNDISSDEIFKEIASKLTNLSGQQRPRKKKTLINYIKHLKKGDPEKIMNLLIEHDLVVVSHDGKAQYNL